MSKSAAAPVAKVADEGFSLLGKARPVGSAVTKAKSSEVPVFLAEVDLEGLMPDEGTHAYESGNNGGEQELEVDMDEESGEGEEIRLPSDPDDEPDVLPAPGEDDVEEDDADSTGYGAPYVHRSMSEQMPPQSAYAAGESLEEPAEIGLDLDIPEDAFESDDLDEVLDAEQKAVTLDTYMSRIKTVNFVLDNLGKAYRRRQKRQTVVDLMREFAEVLEHYRMLNDTNVHSLVKDTFSIVQDGPEKADWMAYYHSSLYACQEGSSAVDNLEECI